MRLPSEAYLEVFPQRCNVLDIQEIFTGHVTPFLKSINTPLSSCSLRDGTISFIK